MAFIGEAVAQGLADARLADAGLARQQHHLPFAVARQAPAFEQQRHLAGAADEFDQPALVLRLEAARHAALAAHAPRLDRRDKALQLECSGRLELERRTHQAARLGRQHDLARRGMGLQARREVGRFAAGRLLRGRRAGADLADHHEAGGDADARLQVDAALRLGRPGGSIKCRHGLEHVQRRVHRALRVVLVRARIAEVDQAAIAEQLRHMAVVRRHRGGHRVVIASDQALQIFRVEPAGQQGRADQVAEHHGELAPLGFARRPRRRAACRAVRRQRRDRQQQPLAVAEQRHPEFLQVGVAELRQQVDLDALRDERRRMLGEAERLEPLRHVVHLESVRIARQRLHDARRRRIRRAEGMASADGAWIGSRYADSPPPRLPCAAAHRHTGARS